MQGSTIWLKYHAGITLTDIVIAVRFRNSVKDIFFASKY